MISPLFLRALGGTVSYQLHQNLTDYHKTKESSTASYSLAMCYPDRGWLAGYPDTGPERRPGEFPQRDVQTASTHAFYEFSSAAALNSFREPSERRKPKSAIAP